MKYPRGYFATKAQLRSSILVESEHNKHGLRISCYPRKNADGSIKCYVGIVIAKSDKVLFRATFTHIDKRDALDHARYFAVNGIYQKMAKEDAARI